MIFGQQSKQQCELTIGLTSTDLKQQRKTVKYKVTVTKRLKLKGVVVISEIWTYRA